MPDHRDRFSPGFLELLADLGITGPTDLTARSDKVRGYIPRLREAAAKIIAANPEIVR